MSACLFEEEDFSSKKKSSPIKKSGFQGPYLSSSHRSNNAEHKNSLGSNKSLAEPFATPLSKALRIDAIRYIKKDLQQIIQFVLQNQISKRGLFRDKLKVRSPHIYYDKFHIEYYNFCQ